MILNMNCQITIHIMMSNKMLIMVTKGLFAHIGHPGGLAFHSSLPRSCLAAGRGDQANEIYIYHLIRQTLH